MGAARERERELKWADDDHTEAGKERGENRDRERTWLSNSNPVSVSAPFFGKLKFQECGFMRVCVCINS